MYRESDEACDERDTKKLEKFRETWEVLSQESTDLLGELLEPRLAFSGHSHDYCRLTNRLNIEEFTIPSFSWRNRDNPAFALVSYLVIRTVLPYNFSHQFNKQNPMYTYYDHKSSTQYFVFFQALITEKDYSVSMCQLPRESLTIRMYTAGMLLIIVVCLWRFFRLRRKIKTKQKIRAE